MSSYGLLAPEYLVLFGVIWAMFAELLPGKDRGAALVVAVLSAAAAVTAALTPVGSSAFGGLVFFDETARFIRVAAAGLLALWLLWMWVSVAERMREAVALASLSTMGAMLLGSSTDLIMIILALELSTMPAYALIGQRKQKVTSLEGALKYFLVSMLTTLVTLYGMSFLYGISGSTRLAELSMDGAGTLGVFAVLFTLVGVLAKLSAAPFHYWAPDAYAGAQARAVAFVSVVPKVGGAVMLVRLIEALAPTTEGLGWAIALAAGGSMLLGNLAALNQDDVRRLMAYSGVSHAGFLMLGVAALTPTGSNAAIFYALAYALPSMGIMLVIDHTGPSINDLAGLGKRAPVLAWATVIMLVSLIGIPPLIGFFGKLNLFIAALDAGLVVFVVIGVAMSALSAFYYFRIIRAMFFIEPTEDTGFPTGSTAVVAAMATATLGLGLGGGWLMSTLG